MLLDVDSIKEELLKDFEGDIDPSKVIAKVWGSDARVIDLKYIFKVCKFSIDHLIKYKEFLNQDSYYWGSFIISQTITNSEIYDVFGKTFSYFNLWDTIVSYQILPEEVISKNYDDIDLKISLIEYQKLTPSILERLIYSSKVYNSPSVIFELFNSIICNQYLEEDFIISYLSNFYKGDILSYQRLTPKLLSHIEEENIDNFTKNNYFYRTDLGRGDWFVGYVEEKVLENGLKFYVPLLPSYTNFDKFNNYSPSKVKKARIFYKDIITLNRFKKVEVIREFSKEKEINFYKR